MCLYVPSSELWCPLRIPHKNDVRFVFTSGCLYEGLMSYLRYLWLFAHSGVQHILCCVYIFYTPMLPVSLDCPFLIAPSVFSNVYLFYPSITHVCVVCLSVVARFHTREQLMSFGCFIWRLLLVRCCWKVSLTWTEHVII